MEAWNTHFKMKVDKNVIIQVCILLRITVPGILLSTHSSFVNYKSKSDNPRMDERENVNAKADNRLL